MYRTLSTASTTIQGLAIPVGTLSIGTAGATNAALLAASILSNGHPAIREALDAFRTAQTAKVLAQPDPRVPPAGA